MARGRNRKRLVVFALAAFATIAAGKMGDDDERSPDTVVAIVGGEKITEGYLDEMLELMNPLERRSYEAPEGRKMLLDIWIKNKVLVDEAERHKLHKDPQVKRDIADARTRILASTYFQRYIAETLGISDEEAARYYEAHKDDFREPARVTLRHILVESTDAAAEVLKRLKAGEDFGAVAAEVSQDEYTSHQGGLIGEVKEGQTPFQVGNCENFRDVVFNLEPGKPSAVTASDQGYHIFLVDEKTTETYTPLEQVSGRVRERILLPESDVVDYLHSTDLPTKNNGGLLGWIRPGGYIQGIGQNEEVEKALFAAAENDVVGPFELADGFHIFKIDRRREFLEMEFDEVRSRIFSKLLDERRRDYFEQAFVELEREYKVERFGWARTYDDMKPEELMAEAEGAATPLVAIQAYDKFYERFPNHADADKALFMSGFLNSEELKDYATAKDKFRALLAAYPGSDYAASATWMIAHMGEEDLTWPADLAGLKAGEEEGAETPEEKAPEPAAGEVEER